MRDIFATETQNGEYGITALENVVDLAITIYDGYDRIVADDGKVDVNDVPDLFSVGPALYASIQGVVSTASQIDEEILDLSEAEKAQLAAKAGTRLQDASFRKIVSGLLDVIDGVAEKVNPGNPVD